MDHHAGASSALPRSPRRRATGRFWTVLALLALFIVALLAMRLLFDRPTAVQGTQGYAYGQVERLSRNGQTAWVRLDSGVVVTAQANSNQGQGVSPSLASHYKPGDRVQLAYFLGPKHTMVYAISDYQRGPQLLWLVLLFIGVAALVGRGKAIRAIVGTAAGLAIVLSVVIPAVLHGANPVLMALAGSGGILVLSVYFVHGLNGKSTAALVGTLATVLVALVVGDIFLHLAHITDFGTEESMYLVSGAPKLNIQGLVLAAVAIGALGALVDITVGQASAVAELAHLGGPEMSLAELYHRAMNVGFDHIGSLINTLVLAYVGANLPLLAVLVLLGQGWQENLNTELVGVALVQAVVGAIALVLAVPLTTFVAAALFRSGRFEAELASATGHHHHH